MLLAASPVSLAFPGYNSVGKSNIYIRISARFGEKHAAPSHYTVPDVFLLTKTKFKIKWNDLNIDSRQMKTTFIPLLCMGELFFCPTGETTKPEATARIFLVGQSGNQSEG